MKQKRALIVDDNPSSSMVMEFILHELRIDSDSLHQPEKVMAHLSTNSYDLLLLDWMMPNIDGLELLAHIRSDSKLMHLPVIMCTARSSERDKQTALGAGANVFLPKPITLINVRECLHSMGLFLSICARRPKT